MTTYDVYINGIKPDFTGDTNVLVDEASQLLQIDKQKIIDILGSQGGSCISRSVSEQEALKFQVNLLKIGLICVFRPGKQVLELTLESIETEDEIRAKSCPNCKTDLTKDAEGRLPNSCNKCGIIFSKFNESKQIKEEKEEIKESLLRSKRAQNNREIKERDDLERKNRKEQLEKEILDENPELERKQSNTTILLSSIALVLLIVLVVVFFPSSSDEAPNSKYSASNDYTPPPSPSTKRKMPDQGIQEFKQQEINDAGLSPASASPTSNGSSDHPLTARDSLKDAHNKANKVLGAFGLNADAFSNSARSSRNSSSFTESDMQGLDMAERSTNQLESSSALSTSGSIESSAKPKLGIFSSLKSGKNTLTSSKGLSSFLIKYGVDNSEWDNFLLQQIKQKIKAANLLQARQLSTYITSTENYIESISQVYAAAKNPALESEILLTLKSKIDQFPIVEQIKYFSRIGSYQFRSKGVDSLINTAESLSNELIEPEDKLQAALAIGVSYFKAGNTQLAQSYFDKLNELHAKIYAKKNKINASIEIARAYKSVGADTLALKWIVNAESASEKLAYPNIQQLVTGFAYLEQLESVIRIAGKPRSIELQDSLLYQAIQVFLNLGLNDEASDLSGNIKTPAYKAIAYSLIAAYDKKDFQHLTLAEAVLFLEVETPNEKAIVSSRLAQIAARNMDTQKAEEFLQMTKQQLKLVSASSKNDRLVNILAINYLRSLNQTMAMDLASSIQSPSIKSDFYKNIIKMGDIVNLL